MLRYARPHRIRGAIRVGASRKLHNYQLHIINQLSRRRFRVTGRVYLLTDFGSFSGRPYVYTYFDYFIISTVIPSPRDPTCAVRPRSGRNHFFFGATTCGFAFALVLMEIFFGLASSFFGRVIRRIPSS